MLRKTVVLLLNPGIAERFQEPGEQRRQGRVGHLEMAEPLFQALDGGWVDRYTILPGPVEQLTDVRLEMKQQFLAFFVDGVGVFDLSVQLFDQLA